MLDPRSPFTGAQLGLDPFNSMEIDDSMFQVGPFVAFVLQASNYSEFQTTQTRVQPICCPWAGSTAGNN